MRVALDTNRSHRPAAGRPRLAESLGTCDEIWTPLVVLGELKVGFQGGTERHRGNEGLLQRFLAKSTVSVLLPGRETAEHYARMFVQLKRAGTPVPDNDLRIAALALEHDLTLVTRDRHFERIPQLPREAFRSLIMSREDLDGADGEVDRFTIVFRRIHCWWRRVVKQRPGR
jgi:tRNA(fMet)-specific endonuclease VapC